MYYSCLLKRGIYYGTPHFCLQSRGMYNTYHKNALKRDWLSSLLWPNQLPMREVVCDKDAPPTQVIARAIWLSPLRPSRWLSTVYFTGNKLVFKPRNFFPPSFSSSRLFELIRSDVWNAGTAHVINDVFILYSFVGFLVFHKAAIFSVLLAHKRQTT